METLTNINQIKKGQVYLCFNPFYKKETDIIMFTYFHKTEKYCFTDEDGNKSRSLGRDDEGVVNWVKAKDEGGTGDEMVLNVEGTSKLKTTSIVKEENGDISKFKLIPIGKKHKDFDKEYYIGAKRFARAMSSLEIIFWIMENVPALSWIINKLVVSIIYLRRKYYAKRTQ